MALQDIHYHFHLALRLFHQQKAYRPLISLFVPQLQSQILSRHLQLAVAVSTLQKLLVRVKEQCSVNNSKYVLYIGYKLSKTPSSTILKIYIPIVPSIGIPSP